MKHRIVYHLLPKLKEVFQSRKWNNFLDIKQTPIQHEMKSVLENNLKEPKLLNLLIKTQTAVESIASKQIKLSAKANMEEIMRWEGEESWKRGMAARKTEGYKWKT